MAKRKKNKRGRKPPQHVLIEAVSASQDDTTNDSATGDGGEEAPATPLGASAGSPGESDGSPSNNDPKTGRAEADEKEADDPTEEESADEPDPGRGKEPTDEIDVEVSAEDTDAEDAPDKETEDVPDKETEYVPDKETDADDEGARDTDAEDVPDKETDADDEVVGDTDKEADTDDEDEDDGEASGDEPDEEVGPGVGPTINLGADPFGATGQMEQDATANCLWCGAERSVEETVCPTCNHAWIDATIDEARGGRLEVLSAQQPAAERSRPWWRRVWIPIVLALVAAGVYAAVFWVMWDNTGPDEPTAATTTQPAGPTTVATTPAPPATTAIAPPTTTTTTTTTTSTTTTTTTTTLPPIAVVEPPYDPNALTLGAFALGPISFGTTDADVPGRLAATFGQPTAQFPVGENWGMCPDENARAIEFGHLSIILRAEPSGEAVVGYRLRSDTSGAEDDPTATLQTISGLGLGDTLSGAQALYPVVAISELDDGTPIYLVLRSSDRRTLLWGELSTGADPEVLSINSPRPCDGGPFGP